MISLDFMRSYFHEEITKENPNLKISKTFAARVTHVEKKNANVMRRIYAKYVISTLKNIKLTFT